MTNAEIIMENSMLLVADGVLEVDENGMPEEIHTYSHWKTLGRQVKRGEKAIAKFPIWKYTSKKTEDVSEEEAQKKGYCFQKLSAWFKYSQTEEAKDEKDND
jgi:hypothetical protein